MNETEIIFCKKCCTRLYGIVFELYIDICDKYCQGKIICAGKGCDFAYNGLIKRLITNKYLEYNEIENGLIALKPSGYMLENGKHEICAFRKEHCNDE